VGDDRRMNRDKADEEVQLTLIQVIMRLEHCRRPPRLDLRPT
jgi:hypothetical protein